MPNRVHVTVHYKRKPGVSDREFNDFWRKEFPKAFMSLKVVQGKNIKYEHGEAHDLIHEDIKSSGLSFVTVANHDANAVIEGDSMTELRDVFMSKEYGDVIGAHAAKYLEPGSLSLFAADVTTVAHLK